MQTPALHPQPLAAQAMITVYKMLQSVLLWLPGGSHLRNLRN